MIKIVTDSTAYLPEDTIRQHDIRVVPLYVHFGDQALKEGVELSNEAFYTRLQAAPALPTTSQPSPGEFSEVFEELVHAGHEIITLTISSSCSRFFWLPDMIRSIGIASNALIWQQNPKIFTIFMDSEFP